MRPDSRRLIPAAIFVLALVARLTPVLLGGGLGFFGRYDDGVYYSAADALTFGRVPYKDFVMLHPPGSALALAPFAALGRVTTDATGLAVARIAMMGVGGLNAALVALIAARWGRWQSLIAGVMYAGWAAAVYSEQTTFLEPLGSTAVLVALFLLLRRDEEPSPRAEIIAGVALGLACTLKIWYIAPLAVVVIYELVARRLAAGLRVLIAGVASAVVVLLPFFVMAPRHMWDMVVRDQLLRKQSTVPRNERFEVMFGVKHLLANAGAPLIALTALVAVVVVVAAIASLRDPTARLVVVLFAGNLLVLYAGPSFYRHYAAFVAGPLVLVLVIGVSNVIGAVQRPGLAVGAGLTAVTLAIAMTGHTMSVATGRSFPGKLFHALAPPGCITADDPAALIQMNRLSQDFREGCRVPVDVTGITYDALRLLNPDGSLVTRGRNHAFQDFLRTYLTSGSAFVIIRRGMDAIPPNYRLAYRSFPSLASKDGITLRAGYPLLAGQPVTGLKSLTSGKPRHEPHLK
jgi:hypothetical protein